MGNALSSLPVMHDQNDSSSLYQCTDSVLRCWNIQRVLLITDTSLSAHCTLWSSYVSPRYPRGSSDQTLWIVMRWKRRRRARKRRRNAMILKVEEKKSLRKPTNDFRLHLATQFANILLAVLCCIWTSPFSSQQNISIHISRIVFAAL